MRAKPGGIEGGLHRQKTLDALDQTVGGLLLEEHPGRRGPVAQDRLERTATGEGDRRAADRRRLERGESEVVVARKDQSPRALVERDQLRLGAPAEERHVRRRLAAEAIRARPGADHDQRKFQTPERLDGQVESLVRGGCADREEVVAGLVRGGIREEEVVDRGIDDTRLPVVVAGDALANMLGNRDERVDARRGRHVPHPQPGCRHPAGDA